MKICYLGSAESIHSKRWIKYFADCGYEIHWVSFVPSIFGKIDNVCMYETGQYYFKFITIFNAVNKLKKILKRIKPHIVHVHYAGSYGMVGAMSGFHPLVVTVWGSDILFAGQHWIKKHLIKFVLKNADIITCDADHMVDAMLKLGGDIKKMNIIGFGIDINKFKPGIKNKAILSKLRIDGCPTVISTRNLEQIYDVETLIRAIPKVLAKVPNAKFIIAGGGSQETYLNRLAEFLKVSESIRFIGRYSHDKLTEYLVSADVYVSTSLSDSGLATSTAEAMACGLPVVITDFGENRLWTKDGENGLLYKVKSSEQLADKISYLLENSDVRKRLGESARRIIVEKNDFYVEMDKMNCLYKTISKNKH